MKKAIIYRVALYSIATIIAFGIYHRSQVPLETDQEYCDRTGRVKIHDRFFKYDVYQNNEMKPIADMLSKNCNGDNYCEINHAYQYVVKIPYKESNVSRTPSDVINQNGGDCDEKSFLLATLLLEMDQQSIFITTKDHAYLAIHLKNEEQLKGPLSYFMIHDKRYYVAETATNQGYIGQYNKIEEREIDGIYDIVEKKEIPLDQVEYHVNKS
ncbi:MAG: hypothetical protein PHW18_07055 [Sulfuricurvum sp.]|uniref:hypothetical protein n=1 Tax=Sulfuricurvum sp. TaxID=2025608 RepID=UPI00261A1BFC|nr:hypothetical protein [Sulfuricurvum sp.]MDD2829318.1 hypothetical protein [Sulfuricurvum sp.]MDD4948635.1 hypothetical protein [Sulfuricurvum sp.]